MNESSQNVIRIVVDECVEIDAPLVEKFRRTLSPQQPVEIVFLAASHRGIPDTEILRRLLGPDSLLLSTDRVLHNQALALGFRSYTLDEKGDLFGKKLAHVAAPEPLLSARSVGELKTDYVHPPNPIASALKSTMAERDFKRYRTRRRRIRSYFGSEANISSASLTIGARTTTRGLISGFFLSLGGYSGVKGIRANEGYALTLANEHEPAWCVIHALRDLYLLQLETVAVEIYIIPPASLALCQDLLSGSAPISQSPGDESLRRLLQGLKSVRAFPCGKGPFFEGMKNKLQQLASGRSNELVVTESHSIINALEQADACIIRTVAGD